MAIKLLFGKHLLTCDFPNCGNSLHIAKKDIEKITEKLKEYNWLSFELLESKKIAFLCKAHQSITLLQKKQFEQIRENAHTILSR